MKMNNLVKQARQMQTQIAKMQEQLANEQVESSVGGGMVKTVFSGQGDLLKIEIEKDVINPDDKDMLEELILSAVNEGIKASRDLMASQMGGITGALGSMGLGF